MIKKIRDALGGSEHGKVIAVLGLTFKPQTDDMREAASLTIIPALQEGGAIIKATDPKGMQEARKHLDNIEYYDNLYEAVQGADAVVIMTEWNEYRALNLEKLRKTMNGEIFIDLKNVYDPKTVHEKGFTYIGVGIT
jgi:UDPglucose 6-dehydrogenase